jgi:hypothetical protein
LALNPFGIIFTPHPRNLSPPEPFYGSASILNNVLCFGMEPLLSNFNLPQVLALNPFGIIFTPHPRNLSPPEPFYGSASILNNVLCFVFDNLKLNKAEYN